MRRELRARAPDRLPARQDQCSVQQIAPPPVAEALQLAAAGPMRVRRVRRARLRRRARVLLVVPVQRAQGSRVPVRALQPLVRVVLPGLPEALAEPVVLARAARLVAVQLAAAEPCPVTAAS